ncbi:hypothetical protein glysoja_034411 [Glycine soja]|nr:hypothetical protein glysoja_034411 [Glycine soja]
MSLTIKIYKQHPNKYYLYHLQSNDTNSTLTNSIYFTKIGTRPSHWHSTSIYNFNVSSSVSRHRKVCGFSLNQFRSHPTRVDEELEDERSINRITGVLESMDTQKSQPEKQSSSAATAPSVTSCQKKKNEEAAFLDDLKDHIDEFIKASMDEHKSCFKKIIQKMFGMSKTVAEGHSNASKEIQSSLHLQTTVQD